MTARSILIVNRATSLQRIEKSLPAKVVEGLPARPEERLNAVLDYLANALDKKKAPKEPEPEPINAVEPEPSDPTSLVEVDSEDDGVQERESGTKVSKK